MCTQTPGSAGHWSCPEIPSLRAPAGIVVPNPIPNPDLVEAGARDSPELQGRGYPLEITQVRWPYQLRYSTLQLYSYLINLSPNSKDTGGGHPQPNPNTQVVPLPPTCPLPDDYPKFLGASGSPTLTPEGPLYISVPLKGPKS